MVEAPSRTFAPTAASGPVLDVVVVAYRSRDLLESCLASLRDHAPYASYAVYVFDNACDDGTGEMVRSGFTKSELIASDRNLGFAAANNAAIRRGRGLVFKTPGQRGRGIDDKGRCGPRE